MYLLKEGSIQESENYLLFVKVYILKTKNSFANFPVQYIFDPTRFCDRVGVRQSGIWGVNYLSRIFSCELYSNVISVL